MTAKSTSTLKPKLSDPVLSLERSLAAGASEGSTRAGLMGSWPRGGGAAGMELFRAGGAACGRFEGKFSDGSRAAGA